MDWNGRVVLITGGSSGVGLAFARMLVGRGASVALVARDAVALDKAVIELGGPQHAAAFPLDVARRDELVLLPQRVIERFGRLDGVIHSAGVNHRGSFASRSRSQVAQILDVNLCAPLLLTHAALPHLPPGGVVINVASLAGKVPVPHEATYSATKAALRAFSRALGAEESVGLRVLSVCPGPIRTPFLEDFEAVPNLVFSQPMSTAEEVADAGLRALDEGASEVDVPVASGKLATLGYLLPFLMKATKPLLELQGARNKRKFAREFKKG